VRNKDLAATKIDRLTLAMERLAGAKEQLSGPDQGQHHLHDDPGRLDGGGRAINATVAHLALNGKGGGRCGGRIN